ncbi:MAG: DUF2070 family protein [Nitrososphaerales archaeon]
MNEESVSRIHKRFYLTLINPASHVTSLLISFFCASLIVVLSYIYYLDLSLQNLVVVLPVSLVVLYAGKIIDFAILKRTPVAKLAKIYHTATFANILWLLTVALGIASTFILEKPETHFHFIVAGMLLAAGLRIGIFTSVFGASLPQAVLASPILPLLFFLSFVPIERVPLYLSDPLGLGFGIGLMTIALIWVVLSDRAGRPNVVSTFKLLQAYILAWTDLNPKSMEVIMEGRAHESKVNTYTLAFKTPSARSLIVVPDVHPGPFYPVGGSNLPYEIYRTYSSNSIHAVVMHSISDHALNLPSKTQVERYLRSLDNQALFEGGNTCTEPIVIQVNKARVTGFAFGRVAMLMLSLAPYGMEDVPELIRREVESYAKMKGFNCVLVIDTHNSIGKFLREDDSSDMLKSCKVAVDELKMKPQYNFRFGFCHSSEVGASADDVGPAGMSVVTIKVNHKPFAIGWADSNNMARRLRERILDHLTANGIAMLEVCTSDTHYTSGKARNLAGYFTFGSLSPPDSVSSWYLEMAKKASERTANASYEVSETSSEVKLMGGEQFSDYSTALDRSMDVTKISIGVTIAVYIVMLIVG